MAVQSRPDQTLDRLGRLAHLRISFRASRLSTASWTQCERCSPMSCSATDRSAPVVAEIWVKTSMQ